MNTDTIDRVIKLASIIARMVLDAATPILLVMILGAIKEQTRWWKDDEEIDSIGK